MSVLELCGGMQFDTPLGKNSYSHFELIVSTASSSAQPSRSQREYTATAQRWPLQYLNVFGGSLPYRRLYSRFTTRPARLRHCTKNLPKNVPSSSSASDRLISCWGLRGLRALRGLRGGLREQ